MIQLVRTAALLSALATAVPASAQDASTPVQGSGAAAGSAAPNAAPAPPSQTLAPQAELMAQAQRLRMLNVGGVEVVKLDSAQAAQLSRNPPLRVEQPQAAPAGTGDAPATEPGDAQDFSRTTAPGAFLASFVEDTLNQIPVVQTALLANDVSAADVLRIDIHENNDVTIYAAGL